MVGFTVAGDPEGEIIGTWVTDAAGDAAGGTVLGAFEGGRVGRIVSDSVGSTVVGVIERDPVGESVGSFVGSAVRAVVGETVLGTVEGLEIDVGKDIDGVNAGTLLEGKSVGIIEPSSIVLGDGALVHT